MTCRPAKGSASVCQTAESIRLKRCVQAASYVVCRESDSCNCRGRQESYLCCELCLAPLELLKGKLGDLCDNVVNGGLKAGWGLLGDVIGNLM